MSIEENKELVRRFADERMNNGNLDIHDEMLAPGLDIEGWKEWIRYLRAAFGNIRYTILDIIAEDDKVVLHWRFSATHQGDFLGVAATSKQVTVQGLALFRVMDSKIAEKNLERCLTQSAPDGWDSALFSGLVLSFSSFPFSSFFSPATG